MDQISRKIDIQYFLSVEGKTREKSAKRMIRKVIFIEYYDFDDEEEIVDLNEDDGNTLQLN